jgi:alcohol dehydrogenase
MTRTTLAAVFLGPGLPLELREVPLPDVSGARVLVEVLACTLCGSDLHTMHGRRTVPVPTVLGHEVLGRIAAFGPESPRSDAAGLPLRVGDRVTWGIVASCGDCFYCRRSLPQKCERQVKYGHEPLRPGFELTGGLAGHCLLAPGTTVFRVPDDLPDAVACPVNCATATVAAALEAAGPIVGRRVLVMGSGMLGVTAMAWARTLGAEAVIACDVSPDRLALARRFGATHMAPPDDLARVVLEMTGGHGVDVAFEMTGTAEAVEAVLPLARLGGGVVLVGSVFPTRPVPIAPEQIVRRCLTVRGIHNYAPDHLRTALDFLAARPPFPFESLVADWRPLGTIEQALASPGPPGCLRLGIRPVL